MSSHGLEDRVAHQLLSAVWLDQPEPADRVGVGPADGPCIERHGSGPLNVPPGNWITHGPKPRDMRANESSSCRC